MHTYRLPVSGSTKSAGNEKQFIAAYRRQVMNAFAKACKLPVTPDDNLHFVTIGVADKKYVQCLLHDDDTQVYCEAASGFWGKRPYTGFSPAQLRVIADQGFWLDGTNKNFRFDDYVGGRKDLQNITDMMLKILYKSYDAKIGDVIISYPIETIPSH